MPRILRSRRHGIPYRRAGRWIWVETFAKFLSLPTAETQTQVFSCFRPKYRLILPK
ncbi:hypothetical protein GHI80_11150, partial [Neisseria meningitidis]|nr:hypothetical protein [Neisseria meningitidis]MBG9043555.1 hypothetical protein [Neisseria meningitidis]MBG9044241.1 hypothetical protein [Neisseria meningitidis]MBG9047305.1 hypothetical protein [Neisseria meningitidis]MBG9049236.1 hypothetical protein [Neisseria meningitidis]